MIEIIYVREKRLVLDNVPGLWPRERRAHYLLSDVHTPLSADPRVWPPLPGGDRGVDVVITAVGSDARTLQTWLGIAVPTEASSELVGLHRVGYDVCDATLTSGLLNCGYRDHERVSLAAWGARLNEWHLFEDVEAASLFVALTDERVPEHRPFGVFGVYRFDAGHAKAAHH